MEASSCLVHRNFRNHDEVAAQRSREPQELNETDDDEDVRVKRLCSRSTGSLGG